LFGESVQAQFEEWAQVLHPVRVLVPFGELVRELSVVLALVLDWEGVKVLVAVGDWVKGRALDQAEG
jgi:hypothetical protein